MHRILITALAAALACSPLFVDARGSKATDVPRDSHGKIERSTKAKGIQEAAPLPVNRKIVCGLSGLRNRSRYATEAWWCRRAEQHAVADDPSCETEGQGRVIIAWSLAATVLREMHGIFGSHRLPVYH